MYQRLPETNGRGIPGIKLDIFDPEFIVEVEARIDTLPTLSNSDVALALEDAENRYVYYHAELCTFIDAAVAEAARRLRETDPSPPRKAD